MMTELSSCDSEIYECWLDEEAGLERDKRSVDDSSHHRRVQLILLDLWQQTNEFVRYESIFIIFHWT